MFGRTVKETLGAASRLLSLDELRGALNVAVRLEREYRRAPTFTQPAIERAGAILREVVSAELDFRGVQLTGLVHVPASPAPGPCEVHQAIAIGGGAVRWCHRCGAVLSPLALEGKGGDGWTHPRVSP